MEDLNGKRVMFLLRQKWWLILILIIGACFPVLLGRYWVTLATEILVQSVFAMSFCLLYGHMGRLSFGQGAFFGISGYIVALLLTRTSIGFPIALMAGIIGAALGALFVGYFCVRLAGIYFAILTSVAAEVMFYIGFSNYSFLGGENGIPNVYPPAALRSGLSYYCFCLLLTLGAYLAYWRIVNSPFGYSLRCVRDNIERARFIGIPTERYMLIAFVVSGAFAGLAGGIFVPFINIMTPSMCGVFKSMEPAFMSIIGGASILFGPIVGATVWTIMESIILGFTQYWPLIIGSIVIIVMFVLPGGILGFLQEKYGGDQKRPI
jgi:branched-chain amino acid transport system permease protein